MANNFAEAWVRTTVSMLLFFIPLSGSLFITGCAAHKTKKYYSEAMQGNGMLYHANTPYSFHGGNGGRLAYDITYLPDKDSAILNFSYYDKAVIIIDSITVGHTNGNVMPASAKRIFIEQRKNKWHYRYTATFAASLLNALLTDQSSVPFIALHTNKGSIPLSISRKHWKWQYAVLSKVITLKTLNSGK